MVKPYTACGMLQVCSEFLGQELPYFPASGSSMFWDQGPFDWDAIVQHCRATWGVEPSKTWMVEQHGGLNWRWVVAARGCVLEVGCCNMRDCCDEGSRDTAAHCMVQHTSCSKFQVDSPCMVATWRVHCADCLAPLAVLYAC